jgi:hypothetical protein
MACHRSAGTRVGFNLAIANTSVGWNGRRIFQRDAFAFAQKWEKNQYDESEALQDDGDCYGALLDAACAFFGLSIAFDEATSERTKGAIGHTGHPLDFERHYTPPENFLRAVGFCGASPRRLRSGDQRRARRDVRCARPL